MTADLDTLTLSAIEAEEQADREDRDRKYRPTYLEQPLIVEGDWVGDSYDVSEERSGYTFNYWAIPLVNTKFVQVDDKDLGKWKDGEQWVWLVDKPQEGKSVRNSKVAMILKASKLERLTDLKGGRIRLVETPMRPFAKAEKASYLYVASKLSGTPVAAKPTEPTEVGIQVATALLNAPGKDRDGMVTGGPWQLGDFKYWAQKTPGIDIVLLGQIADGSWSGLKEAGIG